MSYSMRWCSIVRCHSNVPDRLGLGDKVSYVSGNLGESGAKKGAQPLAKVNGRGAFPRS